MSAALEQRLGPTAHTEIFHTGVSDLAPLMMVLRLIAVVLLVMAGTNLLSTLLTANRETSRCVGVQLALGS